MDLSQEGALLADIFGTQLLAYLCAADEEDVSRRLSGEASLDGPREEVLTQLVGLAIQLAAAASDNQVPVAMQLDVLGRFDEPAETSVGNALRLYAGGDIDAGIPADPVLGPLTSLLRDAYPLMLVPTKGTFFPHLHLTTAIWSSPHRSAFEEGVLNDPDLSSLFIAESESGGWTSMVFRSTGSASSLQLWSLPDILLTGAWWMGQLTGTDDRDALSAELQRLVALLRTAARGEACQVKALVALTGIVLDGVDQVELPFGILRPTRANERALAPPSLEGMVSHTTAEGDSITASYAGDVVLETEIGYRITVQDANIDVASEWPHGMRDFERLEANLDSLRLASLLVGEADAMLTIAPTWRMIFDPLSWGPLQSWSDPRNGPSIAPRHLPQTGAGELRTWTTAIHDHRRPHLDVAVRRTISASASRTDPVDALVDLVIAWENLFGSRQGEPTLRISAALGWLLGSTPDEREMHRAQASKVYALRSDIVHGNRAVSGEEAVEGLARARAMTLAALRELFSSRSELLTMKSGDERSRTLILGG